MEVVSEVCCLFSSLFAEQQRLFLSLVACAQCPDSVFQTAAAKNVHEGEDARRCNWTSHIHLCQLVIKWFRNNSALNLLKDYCGFLGFPNDANETTAPSSCFDGLVRGMKWWWKLKPREYLLPLQAFRRNYSSFNGGIAFSFFFFYCPFWINCSNLMGLQTTVNASLGGKCLLLVNVLILI